MKKRLFAAILYAVAMGYLEAAVVVYLRLHFYPGGFSFPLALFPENILLVEVAREVATIVMLAAAGWLAGKSALSRFSYFCITFGVWDICYYLFLKIVLDWPASLLTDDILFLLPLPWVGPVLAPILVSVCLIGAGLVVLYRESAGTPVTITPLRRGLIVLGGLLILIAFLQNAPTALHLSMPERFNWFLFAAGLSLGAAAFGSALKR